MMRWIVIYVLLCGQLTAATAATAAKQSGCPDYPAPVLALNFGSRYAAPDNTTDPNSSPIAGPTTGPNTHTQLDTESDRAVTRALAPVDQFISALARDSNQALMQNNASRAQCALSAMQLWAQADALRDLNTAHAKMVVPSRLAGIAMAYALLHPLATSDRQKKIIETWLLRRGKDMQIYFEIDAPPGVANNNLQAWAGLAATRIGLSTNDVDLAAWGGQSAQKVACHTAPDGSLPLEMQRGQFALHYQLHSLTPLVATAALLTSVKIDLLASCDHAILRAADFALRALNDPGIAAEIAGQPQSYFNGTEQLHAFEMAWLVPLALYRKPPAPAPVAPPPTILLESLSHTKLGGRQSLVWHSFSHPLWQPKIDADGFSRLWRNPRLARSHPKP